MGFRQFAQRLRNGINEIVQTQSKDALASATLASALVKLRIQQTGLNSEGRQFPYYRPSYARYKEDVLGRKPSFVDFTLTGELMNNIIPQVTSTRFGIIEVILTAKRPNNQLKLRGFLDKYGNILLLSDGEQQEVFLFYANSRFKRVRKIFTS